MHENVHFVAFLFLQLFLVLQLLVIWQKKWEKKKLCWNIYFSRVEKYFIGKKRTINGRHFRKKKHFPNKFAFVLEFLINGQTLEKKTIFFNTKKACFGNKNRIEFRFWIKLKWMGKLEKKQRTQLFDLVTCFFSRCHFALTFWKRQTNWDEPWCSGRGIWWAAGRVASNLMSHQK